ncbi:ribonuclease III [Brachymonas sp.]|uniref:ribonuclease III n=1 Tax=Brachymonas sp. TaxID=1936292 RepID=UPI0035B0827E
MSSHEVSVPAQTELTALARRVGHEFSCLPLLQQALTHRSFCADHNERLEFLGDSVLNLAITSLLYARLPSATEGELSRIRANLVKQDSLHRIALRLDLAAGLRLGEGERRSGGAQRPSILADAFEAVLGAIYLDSSYLHAEAIVHHLFADIEISTHMAAMGKDPKTALQEWLQGRRMHVPDYTVSEITGEAHQQTFFVDCRVDALQQVQRGSGSSRRAAEQDAAARMLAHLQQSLAQGGEAAHAIVKITRKTTRHARHKPSSQP